MKRTLIATHLSIPALVTLGTFGVALRREPFGMEMFSVYVIGGYLFYAAPHLLWAVVAAVAKASRTLWHAGFIASSIALAAIASLWLFPPDPSGLPLQWMLYWPLAILLQLAIAGGTAVYCLVKKSTNPSV
ncbi:MAG: hypothetical protein NTV43_16320 [Methylococcales bacterium]|nr:hypothetical protein [Methylococcales bacterium]